MTKQGHVVFDNKHQEWATLFPEVRGEYGHMLIIGHTTGIQRHCSVRNLMPEPPFSASRRRPAPKVLPEEFRIPDNGCRGRK